MKLDHLTRTAWMVVFTLVTLVACEQQASSGNKTQQNKPNDINIIGVNQEPFYFSDTEQGGDITFSTPEFKHCRLSFIKSRIKPGYHTRTETFGQGDIDFSCLTDKKLFSMSPISPTFIDITVTQPNSQSLSIKLNATLYSTRTRESRNDININLIITGYNLKKLAE